MEFGNPYTPTRIKESHLIHGWVPYIFVTSILLLVFTALFWYFRDVHQLHESDGSLIFQPSPVAENDPNQGGGSSVHVSIVAFQTPIFMVVLSALTILAFANGALWLVRRRLSIEKH